MPPVSTNVTMTEEEYIQFELASDVRHEYVNGQLIAMPGESALNNVIAGNLLFILKLALRNSGFHVFSHDAKLRIPNKNNYYYPDLFVSNEEISAKKYVFTSAVLITKVLSEGTRSFDIVDKFLEYRQIPELQYYMLIEPVKRIIQLYIRQKAGEWETAFFNGSDEKVHLPALNICFTIAELFNL